MSFAEGIVSRQASQTRCDTPPSFGKTFPGSIFFSVFRAVTLAMQDLVEENRFFGARHLKEGIMVSRCVGRLPAAEGA